MFFNTSIFKLFNITVNLVEENVEGIGRYGGTCECPDGSRYEVGDNYDYCKSLACVHGTKINCNEFAGNWSRRKVTCKVKGNLRSQYIS